MQVTQRITAAEYLELPWDGVRTDLIEGEVVVNQPGLPHQVVCVRLSHAVHSWVLADSGRGLVTMPVDVLIDDANVYAPDLVWYRHDRRPGHDDPRPYAVPDLAVEVRSPSTWRYDIGAKKAGYERAGLPELWLVDTAAEEVLVYRRSSPRAAGFDVSLELERSQSLGSPLLPGFALALGELFAA